MATGTAATTARQLATQQVHYLRCGITFADNGLVKTVGTIPAGSQMINLTSGVYIREVFNAGTANVLDIGTTADDDLYATDLALGTKAFVAIDEAATAANVNTWYVTVDTTITATVALSGTAATTGAAEIIISYIVDNDR
ncbi:hypothetical protein [Rhizobium leguminosarum]|uniref:hypothetical protein n=1 Tax=Rhizobium leguminosarum TaxID=384 RepID=UPI001C97B742|nr:hypothetical protein [Rhizobium leguminosarum]MBY5821480.1 hypothetical protein [Rhizobium leguminosarum]